MLLGGLLIFFAASNRFHLLPATVYENQTQANATNVTDIAVCIGSLSLIVSGIWRAVRGQTMKSYPHS